MIGRATQPGGGETEYCEYFLPSQNQWRVLYFDRTGSKIAEKQLREGSAPGLLIAHPRPRVIQEDFRNGEVREATQSNGDWVLRYRPKAGAKVTEKHIPAGQVDVVDAGFDAFVREHYQKLLSGEVIVFDFASPLHGRSVRLQARAVPCVTAAPILCVDVELASGLLRWLADAKIYLEYSSSSTGDDPSSERTFAGPAQAIPRLTRFRGTVNLLDAGGDSQVLEIRYFYPKT